MEISLDILDESAHLDLSNKKFAQIFRNVTPTFGNNSAKILSFLPTFGMVMSGRQYVAQSSYRYGFQKQEADPELWEGAVSYNFRIEDSRLGRFFSVDPLSSKYPFFSLYQFSGNRPIDMVELEGLEPATPPSIMTDKRNSMVDKFRRKEAKLAARSDGTIVAGTDASRDLMDQTYGARRWYRDSSANKSDERSSNVSGANDEENYFTARTLTDYQDALAAAPIPLPAPPAGFINVPLANQQGNGIASIQIINSGNMLLTFNFSAADQSTQVQVFQDAIQFGRTRLLSTDNLNGPGPQNTTTVNVNITNGAFLTVQMANNQGAGQGGIAAFAQMAMAMVIAPQVVNTVIIPKTFSIWGDGSWGKGMNIGVGRKLRNQITDPKEQ